MLKLQVFLVNTCYVSECLYARICTCKFLCRCSRLHVVSTGFNNYCRIPHENPHLLHTLCSTQKERVIFLENSITSTWNLKSCYVLLAWIVISKLVYIFFQNKVTLIFHWEDSKFYPCNWQRCVSKIFVVLRLSQV